jgi:hypothetical protein
MLEMIKKADAEKKHFCKTRRYSAIRCFTFLFISLIILLSLTGCVSMSDPEASQDYSAQVVGIASGEQEVGQTFISRRPRLDGITLWMTGNDTPGNLTLRLFLTPQDKEPVFAATISTASIGVATPVEIDIPPQNYPAEQTYYLLLSAVDTPIGINGRNEDAYPEGQAYLGDKPIDADLAFRLSYDYGLRTVLEDIQDWVKIARVFLPLGLILLLPGWLAIDLLGLRKHFDGGQQIALSIGLSLALIPLAMLWTTTLGLPWTRVGVCIAFGCLTTLALLRILRPPLRDRIKSLRSIEWNTLALIGVFLLAFGLRLAMVRDLATPAWVDSVHHGMIARLILDQGAFPETYYPYMDINPHNYHPGFHSAIATFVWLSGLEIHDAMLIMGQAINALAVLSVYLLTTSLTKDRLAGIFAGLITGFLTPMPAYYTSWGRYTQLAGLLILPAAFALFHLTLASDSALLRSEKWRILILAGLATGGLFLVHYRVAAFLLCLFLAYSISKAYSRRHTLPSYITENLRTFAITGIASVMITLPWLWPTITTVFIPKMPPPASTPAFFNDFAWRYLTATYGKQAIALAGLGLLWGTIRKRSYVLTLATWGILLFLLANLDALGLPGSGFVNNTSAEITLFMLISVSGGVFISSLIWAWQTFIPIHFQKLFWGLIALISLVIALAGSRELLPILNPITLLSREADRAGLEWVKANIPQDETFLINPFLWGYGIYAGNDGGAWISAISGQKTMPPPVLYGLGSTQDIQYINKISQDVIEKGSDAGEIWKIMCDNNIKYIFLGRRAGPISPKALQESDLFDLLYAQEGVWVFKALP